jgi:DNA modification methylase
VWTDIRETDVLDGYKSAREDKDEKHVCPLQLEVIRRCIKLYSNPGELVLDPFMGIGSTAYVALELGRSAVGFELKESYHAQAVANCEKAVAAKNSPQMVMFGEEEAA